ncbi:MAG: 16S rRNA (adenine(1518)-N(6)/adenine(1519)-N(6))-dimethyltransferase RsmA [Deltaproteobacteria bacterium]|nr:16S rRNA (adenine(1518)-N(6)/adenine(1519)-N(6))-dimethyltransferase RsmA [Deltaproteobacteria bacterium]
MGRRFGQHFLHHPPTLDAILAAAAVRQGEPVLEVGPGPGALTERLLEAGARLTVVEVDPELAGSLNARWGSNPAFRLIQGDVLKTPLEPAILFGSETPYAVVANLPYYLSTPLLFRLIRMRRQLSRLVLMVQKEVALRMAASPEDGKEYGSLSVAMGHVFTVRKIRSVPPGAFRPPPRVESAVVHLAPREATLTPEQEGAFMEHVKHLFTRRRKLMRSTLRAAWPETSEAVWEAVEPIVGDLRPEVLTPEAHLLVFQLLNGLPVSK